MRGHCSNFLTPFSLRYLSEDPCVKVVDRRRVIGGYELYLVEQWACSRKSPTLVVVTYTGDEKHSIVVGVLSIPQDESLWSPKLHAYYKATRQYLARPKETSLGEILVTNLSSFPSALTVIPVADGDLHKHRQMFIVNEDLKRLTSQLDQLLQLPQRHLSKLQPCNGDQSSTQQALPSR